MISNVILCAVAEYNCENRGKSQPLHALQPIDINKWKQLNDSPLGDQFVGAAKFIFSDVNETYFVVRNKNKMRIMHTINGGAGGENILSILNKIQTDVVIRTLQNECGCDIATDSYQTQLYVKAPLALNTKRAVHEFATKYGLEIQRLYNHHFGHKGGIHSLSIGIGRNLDENENNLNNLIAASIQLKEAELKSQNKQIKHIERWCNHLVRRCSELKEEKSVLGTIMRILYEGTETQIKQKILELYLHPFTLLCNATATTLYDISYNETGLAITAMTNIGDCNEAKRLGKKMKNKKYISEAKCVKIAENKYKNEILDEAKYAAEGGEALEREKKICSLVGVISLLRTKLLETWSLYEIPNSEQYKLQNKKAQIQIMEILDFLKELRRLSSTDYKEYCSVNAWVDRLLAGWQNPIFADNQFNAFM